MDRLLRPAVLAIAGAALVLGTIACDGDDNGDNGDTRITASPPATIPTTPEASGTGEPFVTPEPFALDEEAEELSRDAAGALVAGDIDELMGYFIEELRTDPVREGFETVGNSIEESGLEPEGEPTVESATIDREGVIEATVTVPTNRGDCQVRLALQERDDWFVRRLTLVGSGDCWPLDLDIAS